MKKFAQIIKNRVHYIIECEKLPLFHPSIVFIDITDENPIPSEGDLYVNGSFSPNDGKVDAIRELKRLDNTGDLMRVLEDTVSLLVTKEIISLNELPQSAQDKIQKRKDLRSKI